jgi:hypothetical protein
VAQYEPAAHAVLPLVLPLGQKLPDVHATCVAGVAQYEPAAHVVLPLVLPAGQ